MKRIRDMTTVTSASPPDRRPRMLKGRHPNRCWRRLRTASDRLPRERRVVGICAVAQTSGPEQAPDTSEESRDIAGLKDAEAVRTERVSRRCLVDRREELGDRWRPPVDREE